MQDKRGHLIEVAEQLFGQYGFEGTSIRQLAKEAGVNIAMISYYFGSKEKLVQAIIETKGQRFQNYIRDLDPVENADPWRKIEKVIEFYVNMFSNNPHFQSIVFREVALAQRSEVAESIAKMVAGNMSAIRQILEEGIQAGVFRQVDVPMTVAMMVGTIRQILQYRRISDQVLTFFEPDSSEKVTESMIRDRVYAFLVDLFRQHLLIRNT
jgi:AcrR family transcriptional regulator